MKIIVFNDSIKLKVIICTIFYESKGLSSMYYKITKKNRDNVQVEILDEHGFIVKELILKALMLSKIKEDLKCKDEITYDYCYIEGLSSYDILCEIKSKKNINFSNCFLMYTIFDNSYRDSLKFNFNRCFFDGLHFKNETFSGGFEISDSKVYRNLEILECKIETQVVFENVEFYGDILILGGDGKEHFIFIASTFYQQFKCCRSKFDNLFINSCRFIKPIRMLIEESSINNLNIKYCKFDHEFTLFTSDFNNLDISNTYIDGYLVLYFYPDYDLVTLNFSNIITTDAIYIEWNDVAGSKSIQKKNVSLRFKVITYYLGH